MTAEAAAASTPFRAQPEEPLYQHHAILQA